MRWTPERRGEIAALMIGGLSATEIGRRFNVSRNAIIGLVHRDPGLKLVGLKGKSGRRSADKQTRTIVPAWVPAEIHKGYRLIASQRGEEDAAAMARHYKRVNGLSGTYGGQS